MTKYVQAAKDFAYKINFNVDGQPVHPTSAKLTITKNDNTVVGAYNALVLTIGADATSVVRTIVAADNTPTLDNEVRYLVTEFVYGGQTYFLREYYLLRAQMNFPLAVQDVRDILVVSSGEVPDSAIDIFGAYAAVQADIPDVNLDSILTTGSDLFPALITAVKYKAAMQIVGAAQSGMFQMEQADNVLYKRFNSVDFADIRAGMAAEYSAAIRTLTGTTDATTPVLAIVTTETDYITGV